MRATIGLLLVVFLVAAPAGAQYDDEYSQDCDDAKDVAQGAASDLSFAALRLQQCAENEDYEDDCSSEFSWAQSAHSEYESAVDEVSYSCN